MIYYFKFVRVWLKSEREGVEYSLLPGAHFLIADARMFYCSQNNRMYDSIKALLEVGFYRPFVIFNHSQIFKNLQSGQKIATFKRSPS